MEEKKLTDEKIIKALECCTVDEVTDCENCPLLRESCAIIRKYALDLINRQKAEIERLTEELKYEKHNHKATQWFYNKSNREGLRLLERNKELVRDIEVLQDLKFTQEHCNLWEENKWLKECLQQAVKDTAKDIITFVEEKDKKAGKYSIYRTLLQELKEKYEVE